MVSAVDIRNDDLVFANIEAADRTVVEQEPGFHFERRLPPWQFEHGGNQAHKKSAVADDGNAFFRLAFLVAMTGDQVGKHLVRAELALFIAFKSAIPPT